MSHRADIPVRPPRLSWRRRVARVRDRAPRLATTAVGAALAWWFAHEVLGHPQPFFAPVTVVITLGLSYGERLRRVVDVVVGVAVGVLVGDLFVLTFGTGVWQISLVAFISMSVATFLGAGLLLSVQAGVQGVIVTTLIAAPDQALNRWVDALVGGLVALGLATLAPSGPVRGPRRQAAQFVDEVGEIMREVVDSLRTRDEVAASRALRRARDTEESLHALRQSTETGREVAAISPLHRRRREEVRAVTDLITPLDRCVRNLRVVARRAGVAIRSGERVPVAYVELLARLADAVTVMGEDLGEQGPPEEVRGTLREIAEDTRQGEQGASLSAELLRAQVRSMCVDLLSMTGRLHDEASSDLLPKVGRRERGPDPG